MEWPPSTPTRLATLPSKKACRMPRRDGALNMMPAWASQQQNRRNEAGQSWMVSHLPALLVTQEKVSGYFWHIRWMTSICSIVLFTASLFWVSHGVYADQN